MESGRKTYINTEVEFTEDGRLIPRKIRWKDGRVWAIDRVVHTCNINSTSGKYGGIRYTVLIGGAEKYIYEHHGRWYVISTEKEVDN